MNQQRKTLSSSLSKFFFLDILREPSTRPMLIYTGLIILIGAVLFHWLEEWSWIDSFYFVVITLTTIGYGDLTPTTTLTKLISIFYGVNGVIVLLTFFDIIRRYRHLQLSYQDQANDERNELRSKNEAGK